MRVSLLILPLALAAPSLASDLPGPAPAFLDRHCFECHDEDSKKGDLDLTSLSFDPADRADFALWVRVHDKVRDGEMPPKKRAQPEPAEKDAFLAAMAGPLAAAELERQQREGRGVVRRLNRVEFETALSDLLEVPLYISETLPPDAKGAGFDTVGAALNVSAVQMEAYLQAIDAALDKATHLIEQPERRIRKLSYLQSINMMQVHRGGGPFLPLPDGLAMFAPDFYSHFNSQIDHFVVPHHARYRVKVSAYALRSPEPVTLTVRMGGPGHQESDEFPKTLLGNVSVHEGEPQVFEFEEHLERGQMFRIYPSSLPKMRFEGRDWELKQKDYQGPAVVVQWVEVDGPIYESWPPPSHQRLFGGVDTRPIPDAPPIEDPNAQLDRPPAETAKPRLTWLDKPDQATGNKKVYDPNQGIGGEKIYRQVQIRKPLHPTLELFPADPKADAGRLLGSFIPAAFRRPVGGEEMAPFIALTHRWLDEGVSFEKAMRTGYKAVLTSPGFLYQQGGRPIVPGQTRLNQHELAERLSFFLWNTLPDAPLLQAAAENRLSDPAELRAQAERLLGDPKAERFLDSFLGQWLDLHLIDFTAPDSDLYPEFSALLQWSMVEETKRFFGELLREDLGVRNVIHSDFAMLNAPLAQIYGIPGVSGSELRRVSLPPDSVRGGVLTQGSVLKVTANGTTTSPVVRGTWVLHRIMGTPPDPPPPGVPAIEPDIRGATTVRQQLEQHRNVESCASCHVKIDPPGVALESFDVIGGWREVYRAIDPERSMDRIKYTPAGPPPLRYLPGLPVDSADVLPSGAAFKDIREFKQLLLADPDQVARTVAAKLITYATGAPVSFADRTEVERIVAASRENDHGFRSLIHAVIASPLFESR